MICLASLGVIFLLCKSDIAPDGRSDILFAFVVSNARSAYHCRRQYHARSAYHSTEANRVGAPALSQVRQNGPPFYFLRKMEKAKNHFNISVLYLKLQWSCAIMAGVKKSAY